MPPDENRDPLTSAAQAVEQLAEEMASMDEAQRQQLAEALAQLAAQAAQSGDPALAQSLSSLAQAAQSGDAQAASQSSQQAGQALADAQRRLSDQAALQGALSQLQASRQALAQAGRTALAQAPGQGQSPGNTPAQSPSQGQSQGQGQVGSGGGTKANTLPPATRQGRAARPQGSASEAQVGELPNQVYIPRLLGGGDGEEFFIPGQDTGQGETQVTEGQAPLPGSANPALVPYNQAYYLYLNAANQAMQQTYIPASLLAYVRQYFTQLEP